jgi:hypothetical protein
MSAQILRWVGGAGGDTVIRLIKDHDANIVTDFEYGGSVTATGATANTKSQKILAAFPELLGMDHLDSYFDYNLAAATIKKLDSKEQKFLFKTHCYRSGFDVLGNYVIDITTAAKDYPFVVKALIEKNWPDGVRCPINYVANTREEKLAASYFTMCQRQIEAATRYSSKRISLDDVLGGFDRLKTVLEEFGFAISNKMYYNEWRSQQDQYQPGERYLELVRDRKYDYMDNDLSRVERYCLLALSGENFKFIDR